jgi:hypothetical protein
MPVIQYVTRAIALPASPRGVRDCIEHNDAWQMQDAERSTLAALLTWLKPKVSIEVGVFTAGSLGVIARESDHVYALDIDPTCEATYSSQFPNVTFITGDSKATLPRLLEELREAGSDVDFALIDGDHTEAGVRGDITCLLQYQPRTRPLYVLMHDSFNPGCRLGMVTAPWARNPHVHAVEIDFVVGILSNSDTPPEYHRSMWCGFGLAVFLPEQRGGPLTINERERWTYEALYQQSVHRWTWQQFAAQRYRALRDRTSHALRRRASALHAAAKAVGRSL